MAQNPDRESGGSIRLRPRNAPAVGRATAQPGDLRPIGPPGPTPFTLPDLERLALANSPALREASARVQAAEGRWLQEGLPPNPRAGYMGDEIGNEDSAGMHGGFISQEFVRGGKLRLAQAAAAFEVRRARAERDAQRARIVNDARIAFYEVLIAQRTVDIFDELTRVADRSVSIALRLLEGGEASRADVLQWQIEARTARLRLDQARNRAVAAWRDLTAVANVPDLPAMRLAGDPAADLPRLDFELALDNVLSRSPELAASAAEIERSRSAVRRAQAEPIPNLEVRAAVQHDDASGDTFANLELGLPLPVWDRNQGNIQRAYAELLAAESGFERRQLALRDKLAMSFERYQSALQQVDAYANDILPDAESSLDLVVVGYENAETGYLDVLTAQRAFFNAHLEYLAALRELRRNAVVIEGLLLTDSLNAGTGREMAE